MPHGCPVPENVAVIWGHCGRPFSNHRQRQMTLNVSWLVADPRLTLLTASARGNRTSTDDRRGIGRRIVPGAVRQGRGAAAGLGWGGGGFPCRTCPATSVRGGGRPRSSAISLPVPACVQSPLPAAQDDGGGRRHGQGRRTVFIRGCAPAGLARLRRLRSRPASGGAGATRGYAGGSPALPRPDRASAAPRRSGYAGRGPNARGRLRPTGSARGTW